MNRPNRDYEGCRVPARLNRIAWTVLCLGAVCCLPAAAQDPENCLACHRFRGLSRLDPNTNELRLFFASAEYYIHRQGAHARLRCTACHARDEVRVIPHRVETPVDCTTTCHITPAATGLSLQFSHQGVEDSLKQSAHSTEHLAKLAFDPPLLHPGQSECLYCHDQPMFGIEHGVPEGFLDHTGETRCATCHREELPLEINYFANHVAARMKPARPVRQLAQVCAVCHSDPDVIETIGGHDTVASYLHSFHGKASLLGATDTAMCVDCHSSHGGDQHLMLGADSPASSIHPDQIADTCRTPQCHPSYPPEMTSAAVHLELDPASHPPEFYVAAFFILLTAATMVVFFALVILELLNAVVRAPDPEHERMTRVARMLMAHPQGRRHLQRMTVHERVQHWGLAITFTLLVLTGMPIKFADADWAQLFVRAFGGLTMARAIHRIAGVALILVFFYHLGYLLAQFVRERQAVRRQDRREPVWMTMWNFPMLPKPRDMLEFAQLFAHLIGLRKHRPSFGRYNVLEKFEYWAVFWGIPIMGISGVALWGMPWVSENLSGRTINFAYIIHSDEAYLAFIYIATIHLFTVIFAPAVFPLSLGTLTGQAPLAEIVEGHRGQLTELEQQFGLNIHETHDTTPTLRNRIQRIAKGIARRLYAFVGMLGYGFVAYLSLTFLMSMLFTKENAPVEIVQIPKRLDAGTFFTQVSDPETHPLRRTQQTRGPLAHFHQVPQWFQPDPLNSCTASECHTPLPHGDRIEVRAFLNMHATFVDCGVCHAADAANQTVARWLHLPDRTLSNPPAILRVAQLLEANPDIQLDDATEISSQLQALLREALPASGYNVQLNDWLVRLETTHPRSAIWLDIIGEMRRELDLHVRGEYGAKIGMVRDGTLIGKPTSAQRDATRTYQREHEELSDTRRTELLDRIHENVLPAGAMCTPCHATDPELMRFDSLGYSNERINALENSQIMRSILKIESGQPFYLPLGEDEEEEPAP